MQIGDKVQLDAGEGNPPISAVVHAIHPLGVDEKDDALHAIDALVQHDGHPADGTVTYVHKENYSVVDGDHVAPREGVAAAAAVAAAPASQLPEVDLPGAKNATADAAAAAAAAVAAGKASQA